MSVMSEPLVNDVGELVTVLSWQDSGDGTEVAPLLGGAYLVRVGGGGEVAAYVPDERGDIDVYVMADPLTLIYALGLTVRPAPVLIDPAR